MPQSTRKRTPMSNEHKAALAEGRDQGRAVRRYLEALDANKPRRGRKRSPESLKKRLDAIETEIASADPLKRVHLVQERSDLQQALETSASNVDIDELESDFVKAAAPYSERKGITYATWREVGVPAAVLEKAGIKRSSV
ncbi:MAG TPA: hypothetical protein VFP06_06760 [Acidimicrobiales bacterium]|jgi:uncharacterized protein YicC (UPF0701 family)|nr:hypothetical protein [Acidimicrobiales bacterium]